MSTDKRPTSPHIGIYKRQITSVLSITHRLTGVALYAGTALMLWWLWVLAYNPGYYSQMLECLTSMPGQALLFGWTLAFYFHFSNGIRHLFWDMGKGFSMPAVNKTGWLVIFFTVGMTLATWNFILSAGQ